MLRRNELVSAVKDVLIENNAGAGPADREKIARDIVQRILALQQVGDTAKVPVPKSEAKRLHTQTGNPHWKDFY